MKRTEQQQKQQAGNDHQRIAALEQRLDRAERRLHTTWALAFVGVVGSITVGLSPTARAQFGVTLTSLDLRLKAVEQKTQFVTVSGTDMMITGANLHIRNGLGATNGNPGNPFTFGNTAVNGLGNLILGYNEVFTNDQGRTFGEERGGSHNLVIGNGHEYTSYGGMVAGQDNRIAAPFASVSGGAFNQAGGIYASVTGGDFNQATGSYASVSGGESNRASGFYASVSGGNFNQASDFYASVSGGFDNRATAQSTSVSGGHFNQARSTYASVSGGDGNGANGFTSSVSGGASNQANSSYSSISGGAFRFTGNTAQEIYDWRAGGLFQDQ